MADKISKVGEFSVGGMNKMRVRCTFMDQILGACPCDPEVYKKYMEELWKKEAKKANAVHTPSDVISKKIDEEVNKLPTLEEWLAEMKITVFLRNENDEPIIDQHVIKGFFKNAAKAFNSMEKSRLTNHKGKIDNNIFISPDDIVIHTDKDIALCERPLRADTAQGPRVALAASEAIEPGAWIEFDIMYMIPGLLPHIIDWLNYGQLNGLGQWHNGGKGRFTWREITE